MTVYLEILTLIKKYYTPVPHAWYVGFSPYLNDSYTILVSFTKHRILTEFRYLIIIPPNATARDLSKLKIESVQAFQPSYTVDELLTQFTIMYKDKKQEIRLNKIGHNGTLTDKELISLVNDYLLILKPLLEYANIT